MSTFVGYWFREYIWSIFSWKNLIFVLVVTLYIALAVALGTVICLVIGFAMMTVTFFILPFLALGDIILLGIWTITIFTVVALIVVYMTKSCQNAWEDWKING